MCRNDSRTCEQDVTERYFFFSEGSSGAGKNEFVSQFTCYSLICMQKYTQHVLT